MWNTRKGVCVCVLCLPCLCLRAGRVRCSPACLPAAVRRLECHTKIALVSGSAVIAAAAAAVAASANSQVQAGEPAASLWQQRHEASSLAAARMPPTPL